MTPEIKASILIASRDKLAVRLRPVETWALRHFIDGGAFGLEDIDPERMFPSSANAQTLDELKAAIKTDYDAHIRTIQENMDGTQIPAQSAPASDEVQGVPESISSKPTKTGGVRFCIKFGDLFLYTFSKPFADLAEKAKADGTQVRVKFAETKFGKDILEIKTV